jgi:hypothetical protein
MRFRMLVIVALLAVWVLWGSVAVAFDHCAMMGALCEAPCGLGILGLPSVIPSLPQLVPTTVSPPLVQSAPTATPAGLDPVPRSLPPSSTR